MKREVDEELIHINIHKISKPIICTEEHPFLIIRNDKEEWIEAKDIKSGDYVKIGKISQINPKFSHKIKSSLFISNQGHPRFYKSNLFNI